MENLSPQLKNRIMRRVYAVYITRKILSGFMLRLYALVGLVVGLASLVSVRDIYLNIPDGGLSTLYEFVSFAILNTELAVQVVLLTAVVVAVLVARDITKNFAHGQVLHQAV